MKRVLRWVESQLGNFWFVVMFGSLLGFLTADLGLMFRFFLWRNR